MARALWAGAGVRLHDGEGTVEYALHPGGYIRFADRWLLLAHPRAPRGPLTLVVTGLHTTPLEPGARAVIADGELRVGALSVNLTNLKGPGPLRFAAGGGAPPPPAWLAPGLAALARGDLAVAVRELAGRGEGLTPVGDDVLAGYAAARFAAGSPVSLDGARCSPLGLAYLRCAERGQLPEAPLSRWGATSGTAMLWGMGAAA